MKKIMFVLAMSLGALSLAAHENQGSGKSCDTKGEAVTLTGKVSCTGDDCSFKTADAKTTYSICEMSKVDLPKLSSSGATVSVKGKVIRCEGKQKLVIESAE